MSIFINLLKYRVLLFLAILNITAHAQNIEHITAKAPIISLPFSNNSEWLRQRLIRIENQPKLLAGDRIYLLNALSKAKQIIVNPKGGTAFGDLDWPDTSNTFLGKIKDLMVVGIIKQKALKQSLIYIKAHQVDDSLWYGMLVTYDNSGNIINWLFSDGYANEGNPHGNISRGFKMLPSGVIVIKEGAWGDNTDTYGFTGVFKVINNKVVLQKRKFVPGRVLQ